MGTLEKDLETLVRRRAGFKSRVTISLNELQKVKDDDLTEELFDRRQSAIQVYLDKIEETNIEILEVYIIHGVGDADQRKIDEIQDQVVYSDEVNDKLARVAKRLKDKVKPPVPVLSNVSAVKLPQLKCDTFDGMSTDKLQFKNFLLQFNNCIDACGQLSDSSKLTYLRSYLSGFAFRVISHLSISDDNYKLALDLLKKEFLDEDYIVDETFKLLLSKIPKFDPSFMDVRSYINECRSMVQELKLYKVDLMEKDSAGCKLLSHIIFSKLPPSIKKELVHKVNNNYPTISDLFDHYSEIIKTLMRTSSMRREKYGDKKEGNSGKSRTFTGYGKNKKEHKPAFGFKGVKQATLENFSTSASEKKDGSKTESKFCKFCNVLGHNMSNCSVFKGHEARKKRCLELKLCVSCSSVKHTSDKCPGKLNKMSFPCYHCKELTHISALCPSVGSKETSSNICVNVSSKDQFQPFLLPILTLTFHGNSSYRKVKCLLDSGSQRSYLSENIMRELRGEEGMTDVVYDLTTFLGSSARPFKEATLLITVPGGRQLPLPILAEANLNLVCRVSQLSVAWSNLRLAGYSLAEPDLVNSGDQFEVQGLIGIDVLQFFTEYSRIPCMMGSAYKVPTGIVPFGNVVHFLHSNQIIPESHYVKSDVNFSQLVGKYEKEVPSTIVNFVMQPKKSYFTPLETLFPESSVEQGLEKMFSLDSVGCMEVDDQHAQEDLLMIEDFEKGIQFKDNRYYVNLPWRKDLIDQVPSNHKVALSVLGRVVKNLEDKGLLSSYQKVFRGQLEDGIIEKIDVSPEDFGNYVWIPHRPVIKTEPNTTTKIRPVFNCSLKVDSKPSLNEAAFAGVNLMGDIMKLSLYFRSNDIIMLSDIKQAFLQIMLAQESDKNKFCFFMKEGEKLVCYRYKSIIFGFNASPFILNYVIKYHAKQFPGDVCSHVLGSNFYVDNLIVTGNSIDFLKGIYGEALSRMKEGGFFLRSWNSNSSELRSIMQSDETLASHGNSYEKVLGYKYCISEDTLQLAACDLDVNAKTKREVLSQISKVFDPLGLATPVTTKGKLLMRELWCQKLNWDETASDTFLCEWRKHCSDLLKLFDLQFSRSCVNEDLVNSLCIFCDASKSCYGFAVYSLCNGKSHLLLSKSKVAPLKGKTLPILELMAVYLALKCLPLILDSFKNIRFDKVICAVDSQIVLQWVLSDIITTKNVFTRNRLKDISLFKKNLSDKYGISVNFKFVKGDDNPCDLLTRGLTFGEFQKKFDFWIHGPSWLPSSLDAWPDSSLGCLSEDNRLMAQSSACTSVNVNVLNASNALINVRNYSQLNTAFRAARCLFRAVFLLKKSNEDPFQAGKLYLLRDMQQSSFPRELEYLQDPEGIRDVPILVNNLDLFLDDRGLIRSRGRIGKSSMFDFEVMNPILLAKDHHLTQLIIEFYHRRCQHLGIQTTLNTVRNNGFWIPRMRQYVKKVLGLCTTCKRYNSLAFRYPRMTNLPKHRVNFVQPFKHTGVDFTGHLWIKNENDENVKMYLLIFTCLNVRAIHIELVPDMSTHSFVLAFLRFVNLYGIPTFLYSDNAKTFIAGSQALQQALVSDEYRENFSNYEIQHIRIPLFSAWVGATWERLIRTVKNCLYKTIGRARLSYFELLTVLSDVQSAINARPLTYMSSDNDLEVITPSSFLKFYSNPHLMFRDSDEGYLWEQDPPSRDTLVQTIALRDEVFAEFKEAWYQTYLLSLREHCRDLHQCKWQNKIKAGDVVLVKIPNKSRPYWLLGRVLELIIGHDNAVRSVKLKRGDGVVVHHSINHLYPLELTLTHTHRDGTSIVQNEPEHDAEETEDPQGESRSEDVALPLALDSGDEQGSLGQTSEEVSGVQGALVEPGDGVGDSEPRVKRRAAAAGKEKIHRWCAQLNF